MSATVETNSDTMKIVIAARHVARMTMVKDNPRLVEVLWSFGMVEVFAHNTDAEAEAFRAGLAKAMIEL